MNTCEDYRWIIQKILDNASKLSGAGLRLDLMTDNKEVIPLVKDFITLRNLHKSLKVEFKDKEFFDNLEQQYSQLKSDLIKTKLIETLYHSGKIGYEDSFYGQGWIFPSFEKIKDRFKSKIEIVREKREQGLNKLLITPIGISLTKFSAIIKPLIEDKYKDGTLRSTNGELLELDPTRVVEVKPFFEKNDGADFNESLVYYPKRYGPDHGGQTKWQLMESGELLHGYNIILHEGLLDLPAEGKAVEVGGRKPLEANRDLRGCLDDLMTKPEYRYEHGFTQEDWFTLFATTLVGKGVVIDDYQGTGKINRNLASYIPSLDRVSVNYWSRNNKGVKFTNFSVADSAGFSAYGSRSAVRL